MAWKTVQFKLPSFEQELAQADPRLQVLVYYTAALVVARGWAPYVLVTSVKRPHVEGSPWSVHEVTPCRGADLRTRGLLTDAQALELETLLGSLFAYSPAGQAGHSCAWWETPERALARGMPFRQAQLVAPHLHLQVPQWTSALDPPQLTLYRPPLLA